MRNRGVVAQISDNFIYVGPATVGIVAAHIGNVAQNVGGNTLHLCEPTPCVMKPRPPVAGTTGAHMPVGSPRQPRHRTAALNHYGYAPQKLCDPHVNAVNITRHSLQYVAELFAFTLVHCHSSASAQL